MYPAKHPSHKFGLLFFVSCPWLPRCLLALGLFLLELLRHIDLLVEPSQLGHSMGVSRNGATPEWMVYNGKSWKIIENPIRMDGLGGYLAFFGGTPHIVAVSTSNRLVVGLGGCRNQPMLPLLRSPAPKGPNGCKAPPPSRFGGGPTWRLRIGSWKHCLVTIAITYHRLPKKNGVLP